MRATSSLPYTALLPSGGTQGRGERRSEGRVDHPVDVEQVAVLTTDQLLAIVAEAPESSQELLGAVEQHGDVWLVRHQLHRTLPRSLVRRLRRHDAYDGDVAPDVHSRVLTESWRRFGRTSPETRAAGVQVWECVLLQNPV